MQESMSGRVADVCIMYIMLVQLPRTSLFYVDPVRSPLGAPIWPSPNLHYDAL